MEKIFKWKYHEQVVLYSNINYVLGAALYGSRACLELARLPWPSPWRSTSWPGASPPTAWTEITSGDTTRDKRSVDQHYVRKFASKKKNNFDFSWPIFCGNKIALNNFFNIAPLLRKEQVFVLESADAY